jgi:Fe-S cluster assembly ATPase SufC
MRKQITFMQKEKKGLQQKSNQPCTSSGGVESREVSAGSIEEAAQKKFMVRAAERFQKGLALNFKEAELILGVSRATLYRWRSEKGWLSLRRLQSAQVVEMMHRTQG